MKKLAALFTALLFSFSLSIALADDMPPMPEPEKSLKEVIQDAKSGKKTVKKKKVKKQTAKKKARKEKAAAGKKKNKKSDT